MDKIIKYNLKTGEKVEEVFDTRNFHLQQALEEVERYAKQMYKNDMAKKLIKKPFYHWYEWSGWRFYWKAIKYRDWKSIWCHIKREYLTF